MEQFRKHVPSHFFDFLVMSLFENTFDFEVVFFAVWVLMDYLESVFSGNEEVNDG